MFYDIKVDMEMYFNHTCLKSLEFFEVYILYLFCRLDLKKNWFQVINR